MKHFLLATTLIFSAPAAMACETVTIGAGRPGVFYVEIKNSGTTDDALVGITTPAAGMPMLHETVVQDGIASMPHAMSVPVPAGQSVQLAPGGYHGMLMELTTALKEGDSFQFDSSLPHKFRNPNDEPARVLWIIGQTLPDRHL